MNFYHFLKFTVGKPEVITNWLFSKQRTHELTIVFLWFSASIREGRVALSVGHPRGTHLRYVIGCYLIPLGICGLKNNSRRITYGIGCVWRMPSLSPLSSLVVSYKVTKQVEIEWLPIFVFHGFFGLLAAWNILFVLRAISLSFSSFTLEFNNRILEKTMTERY